MDEFVIQNIDFPLISTKKFNETPFKKIRENNRVYLLLTGKTQKQKKNLKGN